MSKSSVAVVDQGQPTAASSAHKHLLYSYIANNTNFLNINS